MDRTAGISPNRRWRRPQAQRLTADFHMQAALLAVERWERLAPIERSRFRELATKAGGHARVNLSKLEYRELKEIWKKLETRRLIAEVARLRVRSGFARRGPDRETS